MHGGEVRAESDGLGKGATFTVRLPVRRIEPAQSIPDHDVDALPPPRRLTERRLAGVSVLVVDDDQDTRELLVSVLEAAGAAVHAAPTASEALATGIQVTPDAIVSDIAMPGQDGYSLMRELDVALGPAAPRVRVALTAFAGERDRERALDAGYQRHLAKPLDPAVLISVLEELLGQGSAPHAR
jgi:CheY-like chemotaxis protein